MIQERGARKKRLSVEPPGLPSVLDRFPNHRDTVSRLGKDDETFRTLCNDYQRCKVALQHWTRSEEDGAEDRREEYEAVQKELEAEILRYLEDFER